MSQLSDSPSEEFKRFIAESLTPAEGGIVWAVEQVKMRRPEEYYRILAENPSNEDFMRRVLAEYKRMEEQKKMLENPSSWITAMQQSEKRRRARRATSRSMSSTRTQENMVLAFSSLHKRVNGVE